MADATQQQRLVLPVGTQAAVEGETATLGEVLTAIDSTGNTIGYSTDGGTTWYWLTGPDAGGRWEVLLTEDGTEPLTTEDGLDWLYVWVTD